MLAMPLKERLSRAQNLTIRGNSAFTSGKFELAADAYTQAIAISSKQGAHLYSNRAAC
jgi:hypothetical protein